MRIKKFDKFGQMKIQQMAFMILAVFLFFILVGLFFLNFKLKDLRNDVYEINRDKTISSLQTIANMPELSCSSSRTLCIDEDKLRIMTGNYSKSYEDFWPVASVKVYQIYPKMTQEIKCPKLNCNYYEIYDNKQANKQEYSTYVNLCNKIKINGYVTENCKIAKLVVGIKINDK